MLSTVVLLIFFFTTTYSENFGDDIYPCNIRTDYTPTVWAPTGTYIPPTTTATPTEPSAEPGSLLLLGGSGPHQGNVAVGNWKGYGAIRSCDENRENGGDYGWCKYGSDFVWSCAEAEVVCRQLGYPGAESYSVNHKYGFDELLHTFVWENVLCRGDEERLIDCAHEGASDSIYGDGRIAGVSCLIDSPSTIPPSTTSTPNPSDCPEGWLNAGHIGCYLLPPYLKVSSFYEAEMICEDMGGIVVEPRTEVEQELITSLLAGLEPEDGTGNWWIGLTDAGHEGIWVWVHDFTPVEDPFWASAPDSSSGNHADCAVMSADDGYLWKDVECWGGQPEGEWGVICQR